MRYEKLNGKLFTNLPQERIKIDFLMNYKTTNYKKKDIFATRFTILKWKIIYDEIIVH